MLHYPILYCTQFDHFTFLKRTIHLKFTNLLLIILNLYYIPIFENVDFLVLYEYRMRFYKEKVTK